MKTKLTNEEICSSYILWGEYVDPDGIDSEEEFERMTMEQRLAIIESIFFFEEQEDLE